MKTAASVGLMLASIAIWVFVTPIAAYAAWVALVYGDLDSTEFGPAYGVGAFFVLVALGVTCLSGYGTFIAWRNLRG